MIKREFNINSDRQIVVKEQQDVSSIIKFCEYKRDEQDKYLRRKEEFRHVAEIPLIFVEQWMRENNLTTLGKEIVEIIFKKINTEFQAFKTTNTHEVFRG